LIHRRHYSNQEPQTLAEIYDEQPDLHSKIMVLQETNRRIKVGIIDSGVDYNHPAIAYKIERRYNYETEQKLLNDVAVTKNKQTELDLRKFLINGFDLRDKDSSPYDFDGIKKIGHFYPYVDFHGTEVAHALTKDTDKIVLTIGKYSLVSLFSIPKIIEEQINLGSKIINMSFNYSKLSQMLSLDTGIRSAIKNNPSTLFVVAAGNDGKEKVTYPGSYPFPNIINVAAADSNGKLWKNSTYGKTVYIAAPGTHKLFVPGNTEVTEVSSGTSFAAPVVSRLAALMLFENQNLTPSDIKHILCETADKKEELVGKLICPGIINEEKALAMARRYNEFK
jgi:subtilisin family serine protease